MALVAIRNMVSGERLKASLAPGAGPFLREVEAIALGWMNRGPLPPAHEKRGAEQDRKCGVSLLSPSSSLLSLPFCVLEETWAPLAKRG